MTEGLPSRSPPIHEPNWKNGRKLEARARIILLERAVEQRQHLRRLVEQRLVEEVQPAADLVLHRRLLQMQLAGHPHQLDLVAQIVDPRRALALGPARLLELAQQEIDAAIFLQHGDALRLGRMRGDHRPDAQARQQRLDLFAAAMPSRGGLGEHMVEACRATLARPRVRSIWRRRRMAAFCSAMDKKLEPECLAPEARGPSARG